MLPRLRLIPAVAATTLLLLTSCGSDDPDDGDSTPSSSASATDESTGDAPDATDTEGSEPEGNGKDDGRTVARAPFCDALDPDQVGDLLGLDDLSVVDQQEPGQEITPIPGGTPVQAESWSCTIGRNAMPPLGITWNVGGGEAEPDDAEAVIASATGGLDPANCTQVTDRTLGKRTRGVDCAGSTDQAGVEGFTLVARAAVVDGALLECMLASVSQDDLATFRDAAPQVCGLFLDQVVDEG